MTIGKYKSVIYQHTSKELVVPMWMWANNNVITALSNFQLPEVLAIGAGTLRRGRHDGVRDQYKTEMPCPTQ